MRTKAIPFLVLGLLLLLGGVWAVLRPEGSPLIPFTGRSGGAKGEKPEVISGEGDSPLPGKPAVGDSAESTGNSGGVKAGTDNKEADTKQPENGGTQGGSSASSSSRPDNSKPPDNGKSSDPANGNNAKPPDNPPAAADTAKPKPRAVIRGVPHPPNQSLGNVRPRPRKLKEEVGKQPLESITPELKQDRRGLLGKYYAFSNNPNDELADPGKPALESRTPELTRIDQQVAFPNKGAFSDLPFDLTNFFVVWEGFFVAPVDGDYWLFLGVDLGGRVVLDSETVLLNDMFSDYIEVSTVLTLTAGLHPLRIEYVEGKNGSVVSALGACNFMYVPTGSSQPVAVPPEMLLLPQTLWSNAAPVIDRISPAEGEVGAEVVVYGHNFTGEGLDAKSPEALSACKVDFSGQSALVTEAGPAMLKVRVPIGAQTGKITVRKGEIPSNSKDFKVSTQFGLFASWHNLQGWANYDFIEPVQRQPDLVRLEKDWQFNSRNDLDLSFRSNPLACRWEGKLGLPSYELENVSSLPARLVRFKCQGRLRVTLGEQTKQSEAWVADQQTVTVLDFEAPWGEERYQPLTIDFTNQAGAASLTVVWAAAGSGGDAVNIINAPVNFGEQLPARLFFPPVVPPKPPKIVSITPVVAPDAPPVTLPYDVDPSKVSVREGQLFDIKVQLLGDEAVQDAQLLLFADGKFISYSEEGEPVPMLEGGKKVGEVHTYRGMLPTGCGEGKIVARMSIVQSDPFIIDVTNKGLITYLYDFPNGGGYTQLPDFGPLSCFKVRKDPWINFENANFLSLPFPAETFGMEWFGAIIIETEGDYVFTGRSDDGIRVWINGQEAVVDDNLHYQREKSGSPMHLTPGTYTFRAQFFENNVHEVFVLYFEAKDAQGAVIVPKQVIPKRLFTWDLHLTLPEKTSTGKLADGSTPQG